MNAIELDGTVAPVTVLRLNTTNVGHIEKELRARIASVRQAFPYAPVVVDVAALDEASARELSLHDLADRLRACQLLPVGVANLPSSAVWNAAAAGMAVVQLTTPKAPEPTAPREIPPETMVVRQPVRSGQVIYAQRCDLIVLAPVNPGAQVIADGHIHVYGSLRGRALAGAQGRSDARVFCLSLEAELVSIAGEYLLADQIPADRRAAPTQLYLEDGRFCVQPL